MAQHTSVTGGDDLAETDLATKARAIAAFVAATAPLSAADWRDGVGMTAAEAADGSNVRAIHFEGRRQQPVDPSKPIHLTLLSLGGPDSSSLVLKGAVEDGRFTFRGPDFEPPAPGTPLAAVNDRLSRDPPGAGHALAANAIVSRGRDSVVPDDQALGLKRVFVTASELGGALDYAMIHQDKRVVTDHTVMRDVRTLVPAVVQPVFDSEHKRTGLAKVGAPGVDLLFRGFGDNSSVRGLWVDPARAARIPGGAELLDELVARTAGRDPKVARRESSKAKAAERGGAER